MKTQSKKKQLKQLKLECEALIIGCRFDVTVSSGKIFNLIVGTPTYTSGVISAMKVIKSCIDTLNKLQIKNMDGDLETEILLEIEYLKKKHEYLKTKL